MASLPCLLDLPTELLNNIVRDLSRRDLCSASRVCTRLRAFAEPRIYRDLLVRNGDQAVAIANAISRYPLRASMTRTLRVANRTSYEPAQYERLPEILPLLTGLQELKIESPPSGRSSDAEKENWVDLQTQFGVLFDRCATAPRGGLLTSLRSCTVYLLGGGRTRGSDLSSMDRVAGLLCHPTLESLTIARAHVNDEEDLRKLLPHPLNVRSTPLKSLQLEQCDISASGLALLLSLPQALQSLNISESELFGPRLYTPLTVDALVSALLPLKDSLSSLALETVPTGSLPLDLTPFTALTRMAFGGSFTRLASKIQHSSTTGPDSHRVLPVYPPHLASLKFGQAYYRHRIEGKLIQPYIRTILEQKDAHTFTDLATITVCVGEPEATMGKFTKAHEEFGKECIAHGVNFVAVGVTSTPGFIPPYFFGEPFPVETVLYDSAVQVDGQGAPMYYKRAGEAYAEQSIARAGNGADLDNTRL